MGKKTESSERKKPSEIGDFIKNTLSSVFEAVDDVNYEDMSGPGIKIKIVDSYGGRAKPIGNKFTFEMPSSVAFDIAITATESSSVNGGIDLKIAKIGADTGGEHSRVSRVSFEIPIKKNYDYE